jgi:DNA-binding transcriptional MerR regulator/effector-binding domain-containing protein
MQTGTVTTTVSIGDFARATHLSVKALRHYQEEDLLAPAEVDPDSGYRRYDLAQIPTAQVIRRLRDLDMPLEDIRGVLRATDLAERGELISRHLRRLEDELSRTKSAVESLRDLLEHPEPNLPVEHRSVPPMRVAAISARVTTADLGPWFNGAFGELYATLSAQDVALAGDAGGVFANALFSDEDGQATVYLPVDTPFRAAGRIGPLELPPVELAVIAHSGPHDNIDRAYGALAAHVTRHALAIEGPIREFYPVSRHHTGDSARWRTEIGWPIFETAPR